MIIFYLAFILVLLALFLKASYADGFKSLMYWLALIAVGLVGTGIIVAFGQS